MEKYVINIGRQLGSGGRLIGKNLSERLGIACYDKELLLIASKDSGLSREFFERADEKARYTSFGNFSAWFSSVLFGEYNNGDDFLCNDSLFQIQSDVVRRLAGEDSCVFVGRCADYILRDHLRCLNVFITANLDDRVKRVAEMYNTGEEKARELIARTDKKRAAYYNYYSNKLWGHAASYHLCINSSLLGIDETVTQIQAFAEKKFMY